MCQVTLGMELSSGPVVPLVAAAVTSVDGARLMRVPAIAPLFVEITITTEDPDVVEIVRDLCWDVDPDAAQQGVSVTACG